MGNPRHLTNLWGAFFSDPDNRYTSNHLAAALDAALQARLPDRRLDGLLEGGEREIRQNALLMLLDHLLVGNSDLVDATRDGAEDLIEGQIVRSIHASLKFSMRRMRRHLAKEGARWASLPEDATEWGTVRASSERTLYSLPYAILVELALTSLRKGVEEKRLHPNAAALAMTIIEDRVSQAEVARRIGTSRSAVHQKLAPARRYLQYAMKRQELPSE